MRAFAVPPGAAPLGAHWSRPANGCAVMAAVRLLLAGSGIGIFSSSIFFFLIYSPRVPGGHKMAAPLANPQRTV